MIFHQQRLNIQADQINRTLLQIGPSRYAGEVSKPKGGQLCNAKNQREGAEGEKKIVIRYRGKMVGSSAADQSAVTKDQRKQTGLKPAKTRAAKDAHNARCVMYRRKTKMRFEELEKVETEYFELVPKFNQMRAENQRMKKQLTERNSEIRCMEIENQELRQALETQAADQERMRLIPTGWDINGRNFSNFDELVAWFASQTYEQVRQGAGAFQTVLPDASELVGLGTTRTDNFLPSNFVANNGEPFVFDTANNRVNNDHFPRHDLAAGYLNNSGAGSSFAANHDLPLFDAPINLEDHNSGLLTQDPDTGFLFWENPSSKAA